MIDKTKIYDLFGEIRFASNEETALIIVPKSGLIEHRKINSNECDRIEKEFIETKRIMGSTVCEIAEMLIVGTPACEFKHPTATEIKSAIIRHFEHQNSIVFQVNDDDGIRSLYYYRRSDIGDPEKINANHKTIYFSTGRCFYTPNISAIIPVKKILLNN